MSGGKQTVYIHARTNRVVRGIVTIAHFAVLIGGFWINHEFLGDGIILQLILGTFFLLSLIAFADRSSTKMTEDEAREHFCGKGGDA